jgi:hypothetical protein
VISSAFISSTFDWSDFSTGFAASNFAFTCSQVKLADPGCAGRPGIAACASCICASGACGKLALPARPTCCALAGQKTPISIASVTEPYAVQVNNLVVLME